MDDRFPKYLRFTISKLSFLAIPNLGMLIAGLAILGFVGLVFLQAPVERFTFNPYAFWAGEYWRIFAFPIFDSPIWLTFFCLYVYFIYGMLETSWGEAPTTIFTVFTYAMAVVASLAFGQSMEIWTTTIIIVGLAFGTLFPEMEFYLFFVLPVKAKWLSALGGLIFLYEFITGTMATRGFLLIVLSPYLIFFGPYLVRTVMTRLQIRRNRNRFDGK